MARVMNPALLWRQNFPPKYEKLKKSNIYLLSKKVFFNHSLNITTILPQNERFFSNENVVQIWGHSSKWFWSYLDFFQNLRLVRNCWSVFYPVFNWLYFLHERFTCSWFLYMIFDPPINLNGINIYEKLNFRWL